MANKTICTVFEESEVDCGDSWVSADRLVAVCVDEETAKGWILDTLFIGMWRWMDRAVVKVEWRDLGGDLTPYIKSSLLNGMARRQDWGNFYLQTRELIEATAPIVDPADVVDTENVLKGIDSLTNQGKWGVSPTADGKAQVYSTRVDESWLGVPAKIPFTAADATWIVAAPYLVSAMARELRALRVQVADMTAEMAKRRG